MNASTRRDVSMVDEAVIVEIRNRISDALIARNTTVAVRLSNDDERMFATELVNRELESLAGTALADGTAPFTPNDEHAICRSVLDRLFELGRLQPLLDDDEVLNITANGCDRVFVDRADGTKQAALPIAESDEELIELLREIGRRHGLSEREFNPGRPSLNLQLPDGSRLFAVAWVCDRPAVAIRRHRHMRVTLTDLTRLETVSEELAEFLGAAVRARLQIIVAGATGAGKTTLLRALAAEIPPVERIVTVETELELGLDRYPDLHPDVVALEARTANVEGVGQVSAADLVRMSLRMNPDRVIVGEVRGDEIIPMLNAMSAGNDGSLCTLHADSSATVFNKLGLYAMQAPERLDLAATNQLAAAAIDLIVFISRSARGRRVASVRQVVGADGRQVITNELFAPGPDGRAIPAVPIPHDLAELLADHGYHPTPHQHVGRTP